MPTLNRPLWPQLKKEDIVPQLKVMSLNVGRFLQERTRAYLERLVTGEEPAPDILCLQDIPKRDLSWLSKRWPFVAYKSMMNHLIYNKETGVEERAEVGVAVLSQYPMPEESIAYATTWGDGTLKNLQGVKHNESIAPTDENDRLIEATEDRVAISVTVIKEGRRYNIATTHGFWVRDGVANNRQRESTRKLLGFLHESATRLDGLFFVADMNPDRDGEVRRAMVSGVGTNHLRWLMPKRVDTTLDPQHPASRKGVRVVADWLCEWPHHDRRFVVNEVRLISGVSDHCAVLAEIEVDYGL